MLEKAVAIAPDKALYLEEQEHVLEAKGEAAIVEDIVSFYGAEGTSSLTVEGINTMAYRMMGLGHLGLGARQRHRSASRPPWI